MLFPRTTSTLHSGLNGRSEGLYNPLPGLLPWLDKVADGGHPKFHSEWHSLVMCDTNALVLLSSVAFNPNRNTRGAVHGILGMAQFCVLLL